jgi:N-acetyl sugar amidotransferase
MDTTAPGILFDEQGRCNFCRNFADRLRTYMPADPGDLKRRLDALVARVKADGRGKPYDCVVGLSGGADSAFALYTAKKNGLRPLAVHMDNGWDSELAANNIHNLVRKLGVDLRTHVINWQEYKRLMQAFFDADVLDVELLYDNAMLAVNYQMAIKYRTKWILAGTNTTTEGMQMPMTWNWFKFDKRNIVALARRANLRLETLPTIGTLDYVFYKTVRRIRWIPFLDYIDYFKPKCTEILVNELGYRTYPYKHYESIFTRFNQAYILPKKFNIDKRKLHLSTLIVSGQLTRDAAVKKMEEIPYPSESDLHDDIEYFIKKMGWSREQLDAYIARPEVPHARYGTEKPLWDRLAKLAQRMNLVPRHVVIEETA